MAVSSAQKREVQIVGQRSHDAAQPNRSNTVIPFSAPRLADSSSLSPGRCSSEDDGNVRSTRCNHSPARSSIADRLSGIGNQNAAGRLDVHGLRKESDHLLQCEEEALRSPMGDCNRATPRDLLREKGPDAARRPDDIDQAHSLRIAGCASIASSAMRFDAPMMLCGATALSVEIKIIRARAMLRGDFRQHARCRCCSWRRRQTDFAP